MNTFSKRIVWFVVFFCMIVGWWVKGQTAVSAQNLPSPHTPTAPTSEPPAVYLEQWGSNGTGAGQFSQPYAVETDADGNIFVADRGNDRIQKFDADGTFITQWGSSGSGVTQFSLIIDIAVSPYGYVYVTDFGNDRVTMFDNDGIYIYSWAWGNGALVNPRGITVDHWGNVFVVDGGNDRVIKFDAGGDYILEWGTSGTSNGQFNNPAGIAVDSTGRVFVSDTTNDNIQAFDNNGVYKDKWGSTGTGDGQFNYPYSLAIDGDDSVYVIDATNANIQRFNNGGAHLANWGTSGSGNGQLNSPFGIEIEANGNILVADSNNNRIQRFRPPVIRRCNVVIGNTYEFSHVQAMFTEVSDRSYLTHWSPDGVFEISTGIAVDNDDEVFILVRPFTSTFYQVQKFDLAGNFITQWGSPNGTVAAFSNPEGITTDGAGNVYVADTGKDRIRKYDNDGNFITSWGDNTVFRDPTDIAISAENVAYIVDSGNNRIRRMTDGGISIGMWGTVGTGSGQFTDPQGIAIGPDGSVYVTELGTDRVQKFDAEGNFITSWGGFGSGEGQFDNPYGITVDDEGAVFVSDLGNDRIQQFDSDGNFVTEWGEEGTGNGEFNAPIDIASGTGARLYVADSINGRIQWFSGTSCLGLTWYDEDPPLANDSVMTGQYWDIVKSGTVRVNLTLPQNNYANPQVCRKSFLTWTCGQDSFSSQSVTRNGLNTFGSTYLWAVGDCMVMTTPNIISRVYDLNTGEVTLNWTGNTERYVVRRTTDPMGTGGSTTTVIGSSTYTHNTGGINYFYVVEGYDTDCGLYSEPAQTTGVFSFDIIPGG